MTRNQALEALAQAARAAIDHVGTANYAHRQHEAYQMVSEALNRLREPSSAKASP